jgi:hypothetical protein
MLTQELLHALFEYQPDGRLLRKVTTNPRAVVGEYSGSINKAGYLRTRVAGTLYTNHRLIWFMHHGTWPKVVDHINRIKTDNRIENLRACSQSQNMHNSTTRSNNTTGVKGVSWRPTKNKFRARITVDRKEICVGHFATLEEARIAVETARTMYHGEFARHE